MGYSYPGKKRLFPLDAALNLPVDIYSYGHRSAVAIEVSKNSFSEASESIKRYTGVKIHKRQTEILCQEAAQDFDDDSEQKSNFSQLEEAKKLPLLVLTTDSKGIVVRKQDLREETKKKDEQHKNKLNKRISKFDTKNRKRMATVASVYQIERFVRTPESIVEELASQTSEKTLKR